MNKTYRVLIWKMLDRTSQQGPEIDENIDANTLEDALKEIMRKNGIQGPVYAEVLWNNGQDRSKFEDYKM
jgi:hypothetical protein